MARKGTKQAPTRAGAKDTPPRKLTPAQRLFADYVIEGRKQNEAYALAYPISSLSSGALRVDASRTAALAHVAEYIADALQERRRAVLLTRDVKRQILGSIAHDSKAPKHARILAVKTDNEMTGDNAPVRVEGEITLHAIFVAMAKTTGLPGTKELAAIPVHATPVLPAGGGSPAPVAVSRTYAAEDELVPAMERRRGA